MSDIVQTFTLHGHFDNLATYLVRYSDGNVELSQERYYGREGYDIVSLSPEQMRALLRLLEDMCKE